MVWRCFSWHGIRNLVLVSRKTNADLYINITNENLEEYVVKMKLEDGFVFQQDNDQKNIAKKNQRFFSEASSTIRALNCWNGFSSPRILTR